LWALLNCGQKVLKIRYSFSLALKYDNHYSSFLLVRFKKFLLTYYNFGPKCWSDLFLHMNQLIAKFYWHALTLIRQTLKANQSAPHVAIYSFLKNLHGTTHVAEYSIHTQHILRKPPCPMTVSSSRDHEEITLILLTTLCYVVLCRIFNDTKERKRDERERDDWLKIKLRTMRLFFHHCTRWRCHTTHSISFFIRQIKIYNAIKIICHRIEPSFYVLTLSLASDWALFPTPGTRNKLGQRLTCSGLGRIITWNSLCFRDPRWSRTRQLGTLYILAEP
jgi:hypothetical protein